MSSARAAGVAYNNSMDNQKGQFSEFVGRWREGLQSTWDRLSPELRSKLSSTLNQLPGDVRGWRKLIDQALEHLRTAAGDKHAVAIVGPANVGKSTLYNQFVRAKEDNAQVSAVPGTTRQAQSADAGLFKVIDTPGADAVGAVGELEKERALEAARGADVLLIILDASHGVRKPEQALFSELMGLEKPAVVGLNKIDLVWAERGEVVRKAALALRLEPEQVIPLSAKKGTGVERVLLAVAKSEPGIVAALGSALPKYRWKLAETVIIRAASTSAAIALTPLPFLDFFPLLGVQAAMVLSIARIYAYKISLERARELVVAFGFGVLGRTLFTELSKLGGPPTWLMGSAVAAGTTVALGYASAAWFERGVRLSKETRQRIARVVSETIVERLKSIGRRRPKRVSLEDRVREVLADLPLPDQEDRVDETKDPRA